MTVIFSKSCEYALQAVLYLAKNTQRNPIHLLEIASALQLPHHFLSKVLQTLSHHEIVESRKGQNGGFELGRAASSIELNDIVKAIDGDAFLAHCVLGFPQCGDEKPCPAHSYWKEAKEIILKMLHEKTVDDLCRNMDDKLDLLQMISQKRKIAMEAN